MACRRGRCPGPMIRRIGLRALPPFAGHDSTGNALTVAPLNMDQTIGTKSNTAGAYSIQFLLPGRYIVTVEAQGFTLSPTKSFVNRRIRGGVTTITRIGIMSAILLAAFAGCRFRLEGHTHATPGPDAAIRRPPIVGVANIGLRVSDLAKSKQFYSEKVIILRSSRPGEFHPQPLTDPDVTLARHPARAVHERLPPFILV